MKEEKKAPAVNYGNQGYILDLLEKYKKDPKSVGGDWEFFFQGMEFASPKGEAVTTTPQKFEGSNETRIFLLWECYKKWGHLEASFNPMREEKIECPLLTLESVGFNEEDLSKDFPTLGLLAAEFAPLSAIIAKLKALYTGTLAYECYHIENRELEHWFHKRVVELTHEMTKEDEEFVLKELFRAKYFEDFLQKKFLGAKRFSLEGGEAFLPMVSEIFDEAASKNYQSIMLGMAHRGRLNILCNLFKKPYSLLMHEFNTDTLPPGSEGMGDVKYHKGFSSEVETRSKKTIKAVIAANPSHLESVDPVLLGLVKAGQLQKGGEKTVLPILVHGDASVAGQGVVYESLQLMKIHGYNVGGTIHIVINNQVGFTAVPEESRSTRYPTDIAKAFGLPVIHVNAEDPAACLKAARLAFQTRDKFGIDVFIDLNCHRLFGHNEADEPRFTNPMLYKRISEKEHIYLQYSKKLLDKGTVSQDFIDQMENDYKNLLDQAFKDATHFKDEEVPKLKSFTAQLVEPTSEEMFESVDTTINIDLLKKLGTKMCTIPESVNVHPRINKLYEEREKALHEVEKPVIDWAMGELLAYATLLNSQTHVRLSGQDSQRGTFSHRHAAITDQEHESVYLPLNHISKDQAEFEVYNSSLSEYAIMGYEFGFSLGYSKALVVWEAQFGDFANGAQIIIDQYLAGCETKWGRTSSLTLFLPHGHEGMGSEHTSCRLERFLQLAGLYNWRVVYPSTPAQLFHLLRRQVYAAKRKPLIVAMPKSMLRLATSFSTLKELATGSFQEVIDDPNPPKRLRRLLFCMGKIYYELKNEIAANEVDDVAVVRIEQLYPFDTARVKQIISEYRGAKEFVWVQEEPKNQGAWEYIQPYLKEALSEKASLKYVGRSRNPVPDTGFASVYKKQQSELLKKAVIDKWEEE